MTRQIYLEFEGGPRAVATLLEKQAPETCKALWKALEQPFTVQTLHAMYCGPEIMLGLPEEAQNFDVEAVPPENQQVVFAAGDLLWYWQRPMQMGGLQFEWWEIGCFYENGGRSFGPLGWVPVNHWATITEGLEEFAQEAAKMRVDGAKQITLGQL